MNNKQWIISMLYTLHDIDIYIIHFARFRLKQMWQVTKAMGEMKCDNWTKRFIGVAAQSWLWVRVELMAWEFSWLEHLNKFSVH